MAAVLPAASDARRVSGAGTAGKEEQGQQQGGAQTVAFDQGHARDI